MPAIRVRFFSALLACGALAAGLLAGSAPRAGAADDTQSLLAKNRAFAGWSFGDASMNGLRLSGKSDASELTDLRRGTLWKRTFLNPENGLQTAFGFTGQRWWHTNANGFIVPIIGDGSKYDVSYTLVMSGGIPLLTGSRHGTANVDGTQTEIVRLDAPNGYPIDAYIEPASGKLVRAVIDPDGKQATIDILRYTAVDGKQVVSKWRDGSRTGEYTKIERTTISDDEFAPPQPSAKWDFGAPASIPISITKTRIFLEATVNGVKGRFALDSGANGIALNADFADKAKLAPLARGTGYGLNGEIREAVARAAAIQIGPHVLRNVVVTTGVNVHGDLEDFDGLFGFDFLAAAIVDVDFTKKLLTIYDPDKVDVTTGGPVVLADLSTGTPSIPVTFEGRIKAHLTFDTGDPMAVVASDQLYGGNRVTMRVEGYAPLRGAGGDSQGRAVCGHAPSMELGPIKYENIPICFAKSPALFGTDGGIIGLDFLKHFDLTFDYPESKLYLTPIDK